ncbi:uncharacterized protein ARMOST_02612 [Armillaria ostoyae]|uniref:Uncharacterized protein n=1 Tax=Armillaria ostoyae TaxID=47428 RepID=A0A284QS70_ARMOS|nr:uncharacterized protein ARMOST_02612 [Armillaria ostoyae]
MDKPSSGIYEIFGLYQSMEKSLGRSHSYECWEGFAHMVEENDTVLGRHVMWAHKEAMDNVLDVIMAHPAESITKTSARCSGAGRRAQHSLGRPLRSDLPVFCLI